MEIIFSNKIFIKNISTALKNYITDYLVLPNPDYIKLEMMGKWTGNTPKNIVLYEKHGDFIVVPFGLCYTILQGGFLFNNDNLYTKFADNGYRNFHSNIELYDYQEKAVQKALKSKNGLLVMPCGSGKTQVALELVARLGKRTLWLTHTQDLLNQSMERAKACYGLNSSEYGMITGGKVNIGNSITFATVQTMCKLDLAQLRYTFDVVIVDECHKCVGSPTNVMMFYKVLSNLASRYKFGVTATPKRADGLERCMFALLGNIIDEVSREEVAQNTCPVVVKKRNTGFSPDFSVITAGDGTIVYSSLIDCLINDIERNKYIVDDIAKIDGSCLILTDRLSHIDALFDLMPDKKVCAKVDGKVSKDERKTVLAKLNNGEIKYVFATYKLAKEGLDIPSLRYVVFATPQKDYTTVVQSAGRVGRKANGKEYGTVIDYVDDFGLLYGYSKKRNAAYKKLDYKII